MSKLKKILLTSILLVCAFAIQGIAQEKPKKKINKKVNFSHSANPPAKSSNKAKNTENNANDNITKRVTQEKTISLKDLKENISNENNVVGSNASDNTGDPTSDNDKDKNLVITDERPKQNVNVSIANKTREIAKNASRASLSPTEIYKVGVGDVLYINLQDQTAKYYTVLIDGTIDYPLAGKLVSVIGLTTDEIEDLLHDRVKLYENPQITVKVREYASHKIFVEGLARKGTHHLRREAMPLLVVKSMVGIKSNATKVTIKRENSELKTLDLNNEEADKFLIVKGDTLTFENAEPKNNSVATATNQFYFVGEEICEGGKKEFHTGITLVQAVFEVCGEFNNKLKNIVIIRKSENGKFVSRKYNYKEILKGKVIDPVLQPNDMIDSEK